MSFLHYLTTAWKNLVRRRNTNLLNILGLSIGLAGCLIIFLIEQHEWSYDRWQTHYRHVYQLVKNTKTADGDHFHVSIPFETTAALRQDYPQVKWAQFFRTEGSQVTVMKDASTITDHKFVEENGVFYAEPDLFDIFDVRWLSGNVSVLGQPNTVVLCRSLAEKYFGNWEKAEGQYLRVDNAITTRVAAVISDPPANTDFPYTAIVSYSTFLENSKVYGLSDLRGWGWSITEHQVFGLLPRKDRCRGHR